MKQNFSEPITRRQFLQSAAYLDLSTSTLIFLQGCGIQPTPTKTPRLGFLSGSPSPTNSSPDLVFFRQALTQLGYVDGKNIVIEARFAPEAVDSLLAPAAELAQLPVDLIVSVGRASTTAAKRSTSSIPVVMTMVSDPIGSGLIESLAHPGGNITGVTNVGVTLYGKELELLKGAVPGLARVAMFWDATANLPVHQDMENTAKALGLAAQFLAVSNANDLSGALIAATQERAEAFLIVRNSVTVSNQAAILNLIAQSKLPALYVGRDFADAGGLMAFGPNTSEIWARVAAYVDKVLKGAKPADLPVEQPSKFDFVLNLKTAKTLAFTFPQSILAQATEVIP